MRIWKSIFSELAGLVWSAWMIMLVVGALHTFYAFFPLLGFAFVLLAVFGVDVVLSLFFSVIGHLLFQMREAQSKY